LEIGKAGSHIYSIMCGVLIAAAVMSSCSRKDEKTATGGLSRGALESDFAGKVSAMLGNDTLSAVDSVRLLQYAYQMTACDAQLYKLQNSLLYSYFDACNRRCETNGCSGGDLAATAMAYYLDGKADSARAVCEKADGGSNSAEANEIVGVLEAATGDRAPEAITSLIERGHIKTAAARALLTVVSIDLGAPTGEWARKLAGENDRSADLQYALAYSLAETGNIGKAWRALPDFPPLSRAFPEPSFSDKITVSDTVFTQKIYLPLGLYVRMRIDQLLLKELFSGEFSNEVDLRALQALSFAKGLASQVADPMAATQASAVPSDPREEVCYSLNLAAIGYADYEGYRAIKHPVSRALFLKYIMDHSSSVPEGIWDTLLISEINNARVQVIWESRIMLSEALLTRLGPQEAFRIIGNFGISDLSVRNNSPEWLAIYARSGLEDASQLSLITQIIFNLSQHYPYTIGLYELSQSYNHLCKYY